MMKTRARLSILSRLLAFPSLASTEWTSCMFDNHAQVGDLVSLNCAPATKFYLSWLREIQPNNGWPKYLLESIEDGELGWWSNVGLSYYDRKIISERPAWKWDDDQYAFNDRWNKVCHKKNDAYMVLPCPPKFNDDGSVILDVRIRFGLDDFHNPITFPNWKKVTMKMMDDYYKESSSKFENTRHEKSEQKKSISE